MKANGSTSRSSSLTCNLQVPGTYARDDGPTQPQTATCCTVLHRGPGSTQLRFAPIRTPGSAAAMRDGHDHGAIEEEETEEDEGHQEQQQQQQQQKKKMSKTPTRKAAEATKSMIKKMVRKCKSSVADVDASRIAAVAEPGTPSRLQRSAAVRRDWSFEDLHASGGKNAA
uniref:Uncharacterized protein n=1 Tax=Avena sativa TaxID=4498 RepID=A0ACD5TL53_AVESA